MADIPQAELRRLAEVLFESQRAAWEQKLGKKIGPYDRLAPSDDAQFRRDVRAVLTAALRLDDPARPVRRLEERRDQEQERAVRLEDDHGLSKERTAEAYGIVEGLERAIDIVRALGPVPPPASDPETVERHIKALEPLIRNAKAKLSVLPTTGEDVQYARDDLNRALIYIRSLGLNTTDDDA